MSIIQNPIISGFNPDPSICRVGDDYYIATSTFEWFPGIQIHHSRDLVNWRLIGQALTTTTLLDMRGMDNSEGVYAPNLTYSDGKFWMVFANVNSCRGGSWMATPCYLTCADEITGPWSEPVKFGSHGFDPSLFHDTDGKKYMVNMIWDGRKQHNYFAGIVVQEFDSESMTLIGKPSKVFDGTAIGCTEGPQILKANGYYYLITAEGGTSYDHAVTVCRSKSVFGPYHVHPENPILTSRLQEDAELQRAGHGFLIETPKGEWFLSHLCGRPISDPSTPQFESTYGKGFCILGRESGLQSIEWLDDWPYLTGGGRTPFVDVDGPDVALHTWPALPERTHFNDANIGPHFATLREPLTPDWASFDARPGYLRLTGRQYLYSRYQQSLLARRIQHFKCQMETCVEFAPTEPQHMAGLIAYYSRSAHYFLKVSADDNGQRVLQIVQYIDDQYDEPMEAVSIDNNGKVYLRLNLDCQWYQFSYSTDGNSWQEFGPKLNSLPLSDEGSDDIFRFTGTMAGVYVADVNDNGTYADFEYFDYIPID